MKRAFAIFGLVLISFNTVGYYGILILMERQVSFRTSQKIDENITVVGSNLLLTFPIENTYVPDTDSYERAEGEMIFEGVVYQKIKQKVYHHTLYVLCLKDNNSTKLHEVMDEFTRTITNQQPESSDAAVKIVVSLAKYFTPASNSPTESVDGWSREVAFAPIRQGYEFQISPAVFRPPLSL